MNFIKRKQNTLIFLIVAGLYVAIMLLLYSMHLGNYSLRKIVFMLVIAVSVIMPTDKLPIIIAMLFPLNECIRLSDNSRTILPYCTTETGQESKRLYEESICCWLKE